MSAWKTTLGVTFLTLFFCGSGFAQYGGTGGTMGSPSYSSGKAIGIVVGVGAAAGAGVLYLALRHRGQLTGCVQTGDDGWSLVDAKHRTYSLLSAGGDLKSGQRFELKGKRSKDAKGASTFQVSKIMKNFGS